MMEFKEVVNNETGKRTYYIEGGRVSRNKFETMIIYFNYKFSFSTLSNDKYTRHYFTGSN